MTVFWVVIKGDRLNHPMLTTVVLILFKLEDKKEVHEKVKSQ